MHFARLTRPTSAMLFASLLSLLFCAEIFGQVNQIPGLEFPEDRVPPPPLEVDNSTDTEGSNDTGETDGQIDDVEPLRLERAIPDRRDQGFVGNTAQAVLEIGFVGPSSDEPDNGEDGIAAGRFIGGGVNEGRGRRDSTISSSALQSNGFTVLRRGLRSRVRPEFAIHPHAPRTTSVTRFQARMDLKFTKLSGGSSIEIKFSNRKATISGVFGSVCAKNIVLGQLRLEPGVYEIEDRTSIAH